MLTRRTALILAATASGLVAGVLPAQAAPGWGNADCSQHPLPGCELGAGTPGSGGSAAQPSAPPNAADSGATGRSGANSDDEWRDGALGPGTPLKDCRYVRSDYRPPEGATQTVSHDPSEASSLGAGGVVAASYAPTRADAASSVVLARQDSSGGESSGAWYVYRCSGDAGLRDGLYRPPVFLPDGPGGPGASAPSPEALARQAYAQLRLPTPQIAASPRGPQLVRLPSWLWIENGWHRVSATASVPGVSVTATATPDSVTWSMGDGGVRRCDGPGTPYTSDRDPRSASPDCGYTYRSASGGDGYPVTATIRWRVAWSGAGQSGSFAGLSTSASTTFVVAEVGALNGR